MPGQEFLKNIFISHCLEIKYRESMARFAENRKSWYFAWKSLLVNHFRLYHRHVSIALQTHQMFSVHTTTEEFLNNATSTGHFWICVWEMLGQEITWLTLRHHFRKMFFRPHETQNRCFQIAPVWRAFSKKSVFVTDKCER